MKYFIIVVVTFFTLSLTACGPTSTASADFTPANATVQITSPSAGTKLKAGSPIPVTYDVVPVPKCGDHAHIYVDGNLKGVLLSLKNTHTLYGLAAGKHDICVKVVNAGHFPVGVEKCISVSLE